jgi:uncharacterized membrane protein YfcA
VEHLALCLAVFFGGVVSGFAGFAFSAVAGAILLHFLEPMLAIPLMMLCSIASQITSLSVMSRCIAWREIVPLLIGGAAGVPIALHLMTLMQPDIFRTAFGIFLASYAVYMFARPACTVLARAGGPALRSVVGFAGGVVGGLTAMPGAMPAIWCDLRGVSKEHQRGVVQPFILIMQVFAIALLLSHPGVVHHKLMNDVLLALPALTAGTLVGVALFGKVDDKKFRHAVLLLLLISGCLMIR